MKFTKEMQDRIISWMEQNGSSFAEERLYVKRPKSCLKK